MSGNISAATNSPSPCSKATTTSSSNPAPRGASSPTTPNASHQPGRPSRKLGNGVQSGIREYRIIVSHFNVGIEMSPLRLCLGVSCFWGLLISDRWPDRKPFGGAEKPAITFIRELMQQVRLGVVLLGEGQSAVSDGAGVAHGISLLRNRTGDSSPALVVRSL